MIYLHALCSFIRLCDYLVVTMLHNLTVTSATAVLEVLREQTAEDISVSDLVTDIPDDIEEQEKMLQVCNFTSTLYTFYGTKLEDLATLSS